MKQTVAYRNAITIQGRTYMDGATLNNAFSVSVDETAKLEQEEVLPPNKEPCFNRVPHDRRALADARANWDFRELMRCYKVEVRRG